MKVFNAVIEGYQKNHGSFAPNYKVTLLELPENLFFIEDGRDRFSYFGNVWGFKEVNKKELCVGEMRREVRSLSTYPGFVLPNVGEGEHLLRNPRSIFFRDRRVFIKQDLINDRNYLEMLNEEIVQEVGRIFSDGGLPGLMKRTVDNFPLRDRKYFKMFSNKS
jgi:hypothetical protein